MRLSSNARETAVRWAHDLLALDNFYLLDTETTGIDRSAEIVQLGVIDKAGTVYFDTLVKPSDPIPPGAGAIHGITDEMVADAPCYADLYPQLAELLRGNVVVAYNAAFDTRILDQTCRRYQLEAIAAQEWHCAMLWYARYFGAWSSQHRDYKWHRLGAACAQEGIPAVNTHAAVGDCRLALALIQKMAGDAALP